MVVHSSQEAVAIVSLFLFLALYIIFNHIQSPTKREPSTIDEIFSQSNFRQKVEALNQVYEYQSESITEVRKKTIQSAYESKHKRNNLDSAAYAESVAEVWPPKMTIYLGRSSSEEPARLNEQPSNECMYKSITGYNWRFCLPSLLTISCINCGTTSLGAYLDGHPHLSVGTKKEHKYFVNRCSDVTHGKKACDPVEYQLEFPSLPVGCSWNKITGQAAFMRRSFNKVLHLT